jgi:hypothetical protein
MMLLDFAHFWARQHFLIQGAVYGFMSPCLPRRYRQFKDLIDLEGYFRIVSCVYAASR